MNNEELMMNNEKYKCSAFNVGAGSVSVQIKSPHAITLIALIITIIIMLILAGITLNLTLGEHGIFKTAQNAGKEYKKAEIKEEIELAILDIQGEEIQNGNELTQERLKDKLPSKLNNITAEIKDNKITGTYKGYEYEIDDKFNVTIGKNNGNDDNEEETKGTLTISQDLQLWLNKTGEKITLQDILEDETVGEVKGLIPTLTAENVTRSEENGIVKYEDVTGGIVSTSSEYSSDVAAYKAFDRIKNPENSYASSEIGEAENYWLEYEFKENVKAIYAKVGISNGSYHDGERTYKVQASNDGENWEDLTDEITHIGNVETMPEDVLELNTNKLYKKFRILVTSIGNSTGPAANCSGAYRFQLYGIKTKDNNATKEQIEQKLISSSNINIQLSNAVNMNSLMDRLMHKKETEELIFTNENIQKSILNSKIALSKLKGLIPILTVENITRSEENGIVKYADTTGGVVSTSSESNEEYAAYKAFNGINEGTNSSASKVGDATDYWLEYEFPQAIKAVYTKVKMTNASSIEGERTYKVQASNDGVNWQDLTQEITNTGNYISFPEDILELNINKEYKKFRIYVTSIGNSTGLGAHHSGAIIFQLYGIEEK